MKTDITMYSDNELSLLVFNNESLYRMRKQRDFLILIKESYVYTNEQLRVLKHDLETEEE